MLMRSLMPVLLLLAPLLGAAQDSAIPDAATLMERSRQTTLIKGSRMEFTLEARPEHGVVRTRKVSSATRLQANGDHSRISHLNNLVVLLVEHSDRPDDVWLYFPKSKKTSRVVADGKRDSFMGTVLSYGDVIGHRPSKWTHRIVGEDAWEGHACLMVESLPIDKAARDESGYSKRVSCIDRDTTFNWKMDTWDIGGKPLKSIMNRQVKPVPEQFGTFVAYEIEARDLQRGDSTLLTIQRFKFESKLSEADFSPAALGED